MRRPLFLLLLSLLVAAPAHAQRTVHDVADDLDRQIAELRTLIGPRVTRVSSGGNLQAAVNAGGAIELEAGGFYNAIRLTVPGTRIFGQNAAILAIGEPAIYTPPGSFDIEVNDVGATSTGSVVILLGDNVAATQSTVAQAPHHITLRRVRVPSHRNKRGVEVNAVNFQLIDVTVDDLYDPAGQDSQALAILNTPGQGLVQGGRYVGGSEPILIGGDTIKIPGVIPSDIVFRNVWAGRPPEWYTLGNTVKSKAIFEAKTGNRITVEDSTFQGCPRGSWSDCYGIVVTPRSGGATTNILFDRVRILDVTTCIQMTGRDNLTVTPARTDSVTFRDVYCNVHPADLGGGRGIAAIITMAPNRVNFERFTFVGTGTQLIYNGDSERIGALRFTDGLATTGVYGFSSPAGNNGTNAAAWVEVDPLSTTGALALTVTGNTFTGASTIFRTNFPNNTYVDRPTFDTLVAERLQ
jgi:hypothetical protein